MGRTPYPELDRSDLPTPDLPRAAERRWKPSRPGEITSPDAMPMDGAFGRAGPGIGWGWLLVHRAVFDRGDRPHQLEQVLSALVGARAAGAGRAPMPEDVEVALVLAGLQDEGMDRSLVDRLATRREAWLDATAHEVSPGMAALADVPDDLLSDTPDGVASRLSADPSLVG